MVSQNFIMKLWKFVVIVNFFLLLSIVGCVGKNDNLIDAYNEFAIRSAKAELWNEAAMRWKRVIKLDPNNAKAHNNLGVAYEAVEKFDSALREYELAIKLEPENSAYRINLIRYKNKHKE